MELNYIKIKSEQENFKLKVRGENSNKAYWIQRLVSVLVSFSIAGRKCLAALNLKRTHDFRGFDPWSEWPCPW